MDMSNVILRSALENTDHNDSSKSCLNEKLSDDKSTFNEFLKR